MSGSFQTGPLPLELSGIASGHDVLAQNVCGSQPRITVPRPWRRGPNRGAKIYQQLTCNMFISVQVSHLCLGTMNFGEFTDGPSSFRVQDEALESGINLLETADVYGGPQCPQMKKGFGLFEEIIGRWLAQGGRRDQILLATEVYQTMGLGPNDHRLSAYHIRRACEASLRRLQTDRIDLYQMHHIDRNTPWEEVWQAMDVLMQQGKVLYVGSCNFAGWDIATAQAAAHSRHFMGLVAERSLYNLSARSIELEVIPACRHYGVGVLPWSPSGGGFWEVYCGRPTKVVAQALKWHDIHRYQEQLRAYEALCEDLEERPADIALAWLLHNPSVTAPIVGHRTAEQVTFALRAMEISLSDDALRCLDEIWPGPGGGAPEDYAW